MQGPTPGDAAIGFFIMTFVRTSKPLSRYDHDGSWNGFRTMYYRDLVTDRSTIILSNRGDFTSDDFWEPLNHLLEKHLDE